MARRFLPGLALAAAMFAPSAARAQDEPVEARNDEPRDRVIQDKEIPQDQDGSIFPLGGKQALARGYTLPLPFGISAIFVDNAQRMASGDLAIALGKGQAPAADTPLTPIPFVTTDRLEMHTSTYQLKADLWLLPNVNLFATVGKVKGDVDIGVDIDLAQVAPPPICRLLDPCERKLSFTADVDNTTLTVGGLVGYGGKRWFAAAMAAKTLSISAKDRSDISTVNAGFRTGPRFGVGRQILFTPYVGANYLDLDNIVEGVVTAPGAFADGDDLALRYRIRMDNPAKWSAIIGFNLEIGRRWDIQAEHDQGSGGHRTLVSTAFRF